MRSLLGLILTCWAIAAQAGVTIEHWTAGSGAKIYFVENHDLPILDVQVDFSAGSAYDPPGKAGLAGLVAGMLEAGAGDLNEETIAARVVDLGARLGTNTDADRASITLRTLAYPKERDAALATLQLLLTKPTFPEAVLQREKSRAIAAIRDADTRPDVIADKRFISAIYPNHPYGIVATAESLAPVNRADLIKFHADHYSAKRAVVSIIGDVSHADAERIAKMLTEGLPPGLAETPLPQVTLPATAATVKVEHPAAQAHIQMGLPAVRRGDPDYFPLLVGNYSLGGGGFVSRLMKEVREKRGYAYSVHSYFAPRRQDGPFEIGLQTKREQAGEALKVAREVLDEFLKTGPTEQELVAAKKNLIDGLGLRIDSNAKLLAYLSVIGFYDLPLNYLADFSNNVNAVTAEQVRLAFARHVLPEHLVTVVVAGD